MDLFVLRDIARVKRSARAKFTDEFLDVFLQAFALVIKNESCSSRGPCLGDRPRDAALVRDAEDDAGFACENLFRHNVRTLAALRRGESATMPEDPFDSVSGSTARLALRETGAGWGRIRDEMRVFLLPASR